MGFYNAALHAGLTLGPILGIAVLKFYPENLAFLFYAIACFMGAVVTYWFVDSGGAAKVVNKETISIKHMIALTSDKAILVALTGITLYGAGYGLFLTTIPAFLLSVKGYQQTFIQIVFALYVHTIVDYEVEHTLAYLDRLKKERGRDVKLGRAVVHMMSESYINAILEPVRHNMSYDEAIENLDFLCAFYTGGWKRVFHELFSD